MKACLYRVAVIPIRSETGSTMLVAISYASCRRRLHRVGCEKHALSKDLAKLQRDISHAVDMTSSMKTGGQTTPVQANNEEHPAGLKESVSLQIQEGEH